LAEQSSFADRLTGRRSECQQNVERATANLQFNALAGQAAAGSVKPEWAKMKLLPAGR
jgi:hypothetical protein